MKDTYERCFICNIEKNTFNRTLDRDAFRIHTKRDQNLWNYIYFIIFLWEQDKDDDDGLETYVRRCVAANDLSWFPMNKALRLAQHQAKGDVTSLQYKFKATLDGSEGNFQSKMKSFKDQLGRAISRIEKSLQYENETPAAKPLHSKPTAAKLSTEGETEGEGEEGEGEGKEGEGEGHHEQKDDEEDTRKGSGNASLLVDRPSSHHPTSNAREADILLQLHVKMVYVSGLHLDVGGLTRVSARITSLIDDTYYNQVPNGSTSLLRGDLSSSVKGKTVRFDTFTEESTLVWEGSLPRIHIHEITVRVQILYGDSEELKYIGGAKIGMDMLLEIADSGGIFEVDFTQLQFEQQDSSLRAMDVDADGKSFIPLQGGCKLAVVAVASPQLLEEWSSRFSRPNTALYMQGRA